MDAEIPAVKHKGKIKWVARGLILLIIIASGFYFLSKPTLISVVGEGRIKVKPEMVSFAVNLVTSASNPTMALAYNSQLVKSVIDSAKAAGAKEEDLTVAYPVVVPPSTTLGQNNYQAVNAIGVTLKDLTGFDNLVSQLYSGGVRSIANVVFSTNNAKDLEKQVVSDAVSDAKKRAKEIAKSLGKRDSRIVSITTTEVGAAGAAAGGISSSAGGEGIVGNSPSQIEIVRQASLVLELR